MSEYRVDILRLGHRKGRDPRITTHLALVGRAFGADRFLLSGDQDQEMFDNLASVDERFGKGLECHHIKSPMSWLRKFVEQDAGDGKPGIAIHLTMYGESFRDAIPKIPKNRPIVVVVGGAKVPSDVFKLCQYNVAVGNQPHSEVAALGLFLDSWFSGESLNREFENARLIIEPSANGKKVFDLDK